MKAGVEIISTKQLRDELPRVVRRAREGKHFLVLHRSKPAFELNPPSGARADSTPLATDPVFTMGALGRSRDGSSSRDHDRVLYGA